MYTINILYYSNCNMAPTYIKLMVLTKKLHIINYSSIIYCYNIVSFKLYKNK